MTDYAITVEAIDALLFGDNRSARAGLDHLQLDQEPSPVTLHGALGRAVLAASPGGWPEDVLGERLDDILDAGAGDEVAELLGYSYRDASGDRWYPRPLHFRCELDRRGGKLWPVDLLAPTTQDGTETSSPHDRLLLAAETDEHEGALLVREELLGQLLCGKVPPKAPLRDVRRPEELYRPEVRPGVAIDNALGRVEEGLLFTRPYRRFAPPEADPSRGTLGAGFEAWLRTLAPADLPRDPAGVTGFVGGDRGRARLRWKRLDEDREPLGKLRDSVAAAVDGTRGFVAYLLTPVIAPEGEITLEGLRPVAAAVGKPRHTSGWNTHTGRPRPLEALIPEGSVFFFDWPDDRDRAALVRDAWLTSISPRGRAAGYGRVLIGVHG